MERNLNHDEFDQFLKKNADGLRMHPSEKVWKGIARELDHRRRRFGTLFTLALFLISGTYVAWEIAHTPMQQQLALQTSVAGERAFKPSANETGKIANRKPWAQSQPVAATAKRSANKSGFGSERSKTQQVSDVATELSIQAIVSTPDVTIGNLPETTEVVDSGTAVSVPTRDSSLALPIRNEVQPTSLTDAAQKEGTTNQPIRIQQRTRKISWQIFATPTVSYRKLSDNKGYRRPILTTGIPANFSALYGINEAVVHKPDLGIEFGVAARYPIGKNIRLRTGFQFNINRYDIKAFSYVPEVATIALNNGFWVDSVRAISNYRNFAGGGGSNWLQNFYFQASLPVGLELKVASSKKAHWGIASSLQPTYIIGNRSYMITADYKNYARVPWLTRRWNLNTSLETFMSFNSGKAQWQIGPQVRYQALSSFVSKYPVKEHLFDFGMKVGVTLK